MKTIYKVSCGLLLLAMTAQMAAAQDARGGGRDSEDDGGFNVERVTMQGGPETQGPQLSDEELDLTCGDLDWMGTWLEDEHGNPIPGTYEYWCVEG